MPFVIRKEGTQQYLRSEIDSGGMNVFWVPYTQADLFNERSTAESFLARVKERYPQEKLFTEYES